MLDEDQINIALYYDPNALKGLPPTSIDGLDFTGFPKKHGIAALDKLFPKNH